MTARVSERKTIEDAPALVGEDRRYLCVGPHCWGKGKTAEEAVKNAKKERVRMYEGAKGWRWILFDIDHETRVDELGGFTYIPKEGVEPYVRIAAFKM
jgi:hypothetical protein